MKYIKKFESFNLYENVSYDETKKLAEEAIMDLDSNRQEELKRSIERFTQVNNLDINKMSDPNYIEAEIKKNPALVKAITSAMSDVVENEELKESILNEGFLDTLKSKWESFKDYISEKWATLLMKFGLTGFLVSMGFICALSASESATYLADFKVGANLGNEQLAIAGVCAVISAAVGLLGVKKSGVMDR